MKLRGIVKLRLLVTILFVLMVFTLLGSLLVGEIETSAENAFYNRLSYDELDAMESIFSKYPNTNTDSIYMILGWTLYLVTGILFFVMLKVWQVEKIG